MKTTSIFITIGLIVLVKAQEPKCTFETDSEGFYTCKLTGGGVMPDQINDTIIGTPEKEVQSLYSLEAATTDMVVVIFKTFANLKKLELRRGVEQLNKKMLFNCKKLEKLILNAGNIKTIDENTFDGCPELTEIDLFNHTISSLMSGAFDGLPNLKTLKLNKNALRNIQANIFNITTLESLDLSDNTLQLPSGGLFTYTNELLSLNLAGNGIKILTKEHFRGLSKLTELDFTNNGLNATEKTALEYLEGLKVAKFENNECIKKDYTDFDSSVFADDFAVCIQNFNGASILILSNLALVVSIVLKLFN